PLCLPLAGSTPDAGTSFLRALAELHVAGVPLSLDALFDGEATQLVTMVPPSLLEARPLWPVARRDTLSASEEAAEAVSAPSRLVTPLDAAEEPMDPKPTKPAEMPAPQSASEPPHPEH